MYKNVGKKIKVVSILLFIIGVLASIYAGVMEHIISDGNISTDADEIITGSIIIVVGAVLSWLVSLIVNGFGLIVESAEKTEEIKDILIDIREKKPDYRTVEEKANTSSNSILNSNFNNEVFNEREFSASAPKTPSYVQPAKASGNADPKFVAPTYAGQGKSRPTVPLFRDNDMGVEPYDQTPAVSKTYEEVNTVKAPVAEEPVYEEPKYEEPKYEEPKYEEPKYEEPKYEEPAAPASVAAEAVSSIPSVPTMNVSVHTYAAPSDNQVYEQPVEEMPSPAPVYSEPVQQPVSESVYENETYAAPAAQQTPKTSPEDEERFHQIEELIYKFVARRNGKVNINDILRTVPRNIEPTEFSSAVKKLEEEGRLAKDDKGEYYAL